MIEEPTNIINPINDDDLYDEREIVLGDSDIILVIIKFIDV